MNKLLKPFLISNQTTRNPICIYASNSLEYVESIIHDEIIGVLTNDDESVVVRELTPLEMHIKLDGKIASEHCLDVDVAQRVYDFE